VEKSLRICYTWDMKNDTEVSLEFASDLKYTQFCVLILGFLKTILKINEDDFFNIEISLREVTNNAILHGNKSDLEKKVFVKFQWDKSLLRIRIRDENDEKVDFEKIHKKIENNDVLSYTGRGILIMKNYMDHVEFFPSEKGTEIVMEKRL
jgi:serine/threonine-protein kinase RsbW